MRFCPFCSAENADELAVCQACGRRLPPLPPRRGQARNAPPTGIQLPNRPAPAPTGAPPPRRTGNTNPPPVTTGTQAAMPPTGPQASIPTGPQASIPTGPQTAMPPTGREATLPATAMPPTGPQAAIPTGPQPSIPTGPQASIPTGPQTAMPVSAHDATLPSTAMPPTGPQSALPPTGPQSALPPTGRHAAMPPSSSGPRPIPSVSGSIANAELRNAIAPGPAAERAAPPTESRIIGDRRGLNDGRSAPPAFTRGKPASIPPGVGPGADPAFVTQPGVQPAAQTPQTSGLQPLPPQLPSRPQPPPVKRTMPGIGHSDDFATNMDAPIVDPAFVREEGGPPPTRIQRTETSDRPFTPARVLPVPEIPEPGLLNAARYTYQFARARWQRGGARKQLSLEIKQDTEALDQVLGALGRAARGARVEGRVFSAENTAISACEERIAQLQRDHGEIEARKAEENSKFIEVERERNEKLVEAERLLDEAQRELSHLEGQRRSLRDKRKELERRQKAYLKAAEDNDKQSATTQLGDQRQELRRAAEGNRKEAAALEPERQEIDRRLASLERPINEATAKLDAAKAELDAAKRSLNDAREGHTHRLDELDNEQKRKAREVALAEAEIARRLVTLGTLVNLNRIEDPQFGELYLRIDRLRSAITARTTEIEKLTAEREAYDRGTLVRGIATIGGAFVALIALIVILLAIT